MNQFAQSAKFSDMLSSIPEPAAPTLTRLAQQYKNDAITLSLIMHEKNRRDRTRNAALAQQAGQPQPKVNDAIVSEMMQKLPEDVGIGQLATPNMDRVYDGGLVSFAGGGEVEHYQTGGALKAGPEFIRFLQNMGIDYVEFARSGAAEKAAIVDMFEQTKTATPASAAPATQAAQNMSRAQNAGQAVRPYMDKAGAAVKAGAIPAIGAGLSAAQGLSEVDAAKAFYNDPNVPTTEKVKQFARTGANVALPYVGGAIGSGVTPFLGTAVGAGLGAGAAAYIDDEGEALKQYRAKNEPSKAPSGATLRGQLNRADAARFAEPGVDNAPAAAGPATGTGPGTSARETPSSVLASSALATNRAGAGGAGRQSYASSMDPFSMESIRTAQNQAMGDSNYQLGAMKNQLVEIKASAEKRAQVALARRTAEIESEGDIYKDRSDRLAERGKNLAAQKDQNSWLALMNAGLAIMSTPGSFATALGKGAQVGTAQYAAGLKDLRAAQERLDDANDRIEDLRLNRKDLNKREIRALEKERDNAISEGEKLTFAFAKDIYGLNRQDAKAVFDKYISGQEKKYEQDQMTKRTLATINASNDGRTKQLWAGLMQKHGNDPVAAAREYNQIEAGDKTNVAAEKLVQDRVGEWEKANKMSLTLMSPAERAAALRSAEQRLRNDIYAQFKLTPTMGAGASSGSGFKLLGVTPAP
jgi:hypothetical protein